VGLLLAVPARGQWITQTIPLEKGWNAVFLTVQPDPADCETVFSGLPIDKVSMWNNHMLAEQFVDSQTAASEIDTTDFLNWSPSSGSSTYAHSLQNVAGGRAYLVHTTDQATWTPKGYPTVQRTYWEPDVHNLVGFPVSTVISEQPFFSDYLAHTDSIDGSAGTQQDERVCVVLATDDAAPQYLPITSQLNQHRVAAGVAYYIEAQDVSDFSGPLEISPRGSGGVGFGTERNVAYLYIRNRGNDTTTVCVFHLPSETPPSDAPPSAGHVPLMLWGPTGVGNNQGWVTWITGDGLAKDGSCTEKVLAPGEEWGLAMALDRTVMSAPAPETAVWQSLLKVTDDRGTEVHTGATAQYATASETKALWPAGLWVGTARFDRVSHVKPDGTSTDPADVPSSFPLRLLVHVTPEGQCRLLREVVLSWIASEGDGATEVEALHFGTSALPTGARISRISSVGLGVGTPVVFDDGGSFLEELNASWTVAYSDPLNPFVHTFHPQHDNLDSRYDSELADWNEINDPSLGPNPVGISPNAYESMSIGNQLTLVWDTDGGQGSESAFWNPEEMTTGTVTLILEHIRKEPITLTGTFVLKRASQVGTITE
jgi:hypothetical protein